MDEDNNTKPNQPAPLTPAPASPLASAIPGTPSAGSTIAPALPPTQAAPVTPPQPPAPLPPFDEDTTDEEDDEPAAPALNESPADMPLPEHPVPSHHRWVRAALISLIALIGLAAVGVGAYQYGHTMGYKSGKKAVPQMSSTETPLKVPDDATVVAQCTPGEGKQYIAPKDIPNGPIYNVWNNKVIGLEYMLPESDIAAGKGLNLAAMSATYDHTDVMYEAKGHAGLKEPHYHVVLSTLTYAQEKSITCGGSSADVHNMNMGM